MNALARKGSSAGAWASNDYESAFNTREYQRFHDHFVITKMLGGYCWGYDTPGISKHKLVATRVAHGTPASVSPKDQGLVELCGPEPNTKARASHDLFPLPSPHVVQLFMTSPPS
jgi:hypothetical protein